MCTKSNKQGFAVDIVDKVFKNSGLEVSFEVYPWARAVKNASSGVISGILAPGKKEAPLLMYPSEPIALQQNCFFQNHTSSWRYVDKSSLTNKKIIVFISWAHAKDLKQDIGEDEYTNIFTELSYDGNYYQKAINMVNKGRADAFWADPSVIKIFETGREGWKCRVYIFTLSLCGV
ncbi:substrate-binding periplasmic protein (plasmid) [Vibrio tubiashii]|uniref:substrate-binding periplasmic protein n=1 Tax=Vibrio tubiashii TaxID=29498 RepID=UPI003CE4FEB2